MAIQHYINATRKNHEHRATHPVYEETMFPLLNIPAMASYYPDLKSLSVTPIITFSHSRRVECVEHDGVEYLIYDQYMGQTLNVLTRLIFEDVSKEATSIYLLKYISEKLLHSGKAQAALLPAIIHHQKKSVSDYFSSSKPTEERARSVFIQELYLMSHEVYHSLLRRPLDFGRALVAE